MFVDSVDHWNGQFHTVKPAYKDKHLDLQMMVTVHRWYLCTGELNMNVPRSDLSKMPQLNRGLL